MFLQIITPERIIFEGEINDIIAPGKDGEFQILKDHAPIVSSLSAGKVRLKVSDASFKPKKSSKLEKSQENSWSIDISGGILETNNNKIILLAD